MPRPAPVTSATRPSHSPDMAVLSLSRVLELLAPRVPGVQLVPEGDVVLAVDPAQIDLAAVAQCGEVDQPAVEVAQDEPALRELGHAAAQLEERLPDLPARAPAAVRGRGVGEGVARLGVGQPVTSGAQ